MLVIIVGRATIYPLNLLEPLPPLNLLEPLPGLNQPLPPLNQPLPPLNLLEPLPGLNQLYIGLLVLVTLLLTL